MVGGLKLGGNLKKRSETPSPEPEFDSVKNSDVDERIQELEDLVMLLELESTKIKEMLSAEPLFGERAESAGDVSSLESRISKLEERPAGEFVSEKGAKIDPKILRKIDELEDKLSLIDDLDEKLAHMEDVSKHISKEKGFVKEEHVLDLSDDVSKLKKEVEELKSEKGESPKGSQKKIAELEYGLRDLNKKIDEEVSVLEKSFSGKGVDPREMRKVLESFTRELDDVKRTKKDLEELKNALSKMEKIDVSSIEKKFESELSRVKSEAVREALRKTDKDIEDINSHFGRFRTLETKIEESEDRMKGMIRDEVYATIEQQRKEIEKHRKSLGSMKELVDKRLAETSEKIKDELKEQAKNDLKSYRRELEKSARLLDDTKKTVDTKLLNTEEKLREYVRKFTLWYNDNISKEKGKKVLEELAAYRKELEESKRALSSTRKELDMQVINIEENLRDFIKKESKKELSAEIDSYKKELESMMKEIERGVGRTKQVGPELENQRKFLEDMKKSFDLKTITLEEKVQELINGEIKKSLKRELDSHANELVALKKRYEELIGHGLPDEVERFLAIELKKRSIALENMLKRLESEKKSLSEDTRKHIEREIEKHGEEYRRIEKLLHGEAKKFGEMEQSFKKDEKTLNVLEDSLSGRMETLESKINTLFSHDIKQRLSMEIEKDRKVLETLESRFLKGESQLSRDVKNRLDGEIKNYRSMLNKLMGKLAAGEKSLAEETAKQVEAELSRYRSSVVNLEKMLGVEIAKIRNEIEPEFESQVKHLNEAKRSLDLKILSIEERLEKMLHHDLSKEIENHRNSLGELEQRFMKDEKALSEKARSFLTQQIAKTKSSLDALRKRYENEEKAMTDEIRKYIESEVERHRKAITELEKSMEFELNRVKMMRPPEEVLKELGAEYEKRVISFEEGLKRRMKGEIKGEIERDFEAKTAKILTHHLDEFAGMIDRKIPRLVTRDEFERSWALIKLPDTSNIIQRIDFLEMKLNEIYAVVRNLSTRLPIVVE